MKRARYITSQSQLRVELAKELKPVLKKVGEKMIEELKVQIFKDTYTVPFTQEYKHPLPNKRYHKGSKMPTFQFLNAWKSKVSRGNTPNITIEYSPDGIFQEGVHDSIVDGLDTTNDLDKILNVDGFTSSLSVGAFEEGTMRHVSKKRRKYWDRYVDRMRKGVVRQLIKETAKQQGLNLK